MSRSTRRCRVPRRFLAVVLAILAAGVGPARAATDSTVVSDWTRRVSISGSVLGDARWLQHSRAPLSAGRSSSDLFIRLVETGFETAFVDFASGTLVLNSVTRALPGTGGRPSTKSTPICTHRPKSSTSRSGTGPSRLACSRTRCFPTPWRRMSTRPRSWGHPLA